MRRRYRLSNRVFQLGMRASTERGLLEVATPFMEDLYERTHETVHLGVLDEDSVVYVARIGGHRQADVPSRVGGRMPLHCTAIGKVLLARSPPELFARVVGGGLQRRTPRTVTAAGLLRQQLERVLEAGVAFEHEESAVGITCVAAPILDPFDQPVGAISVTGPVHRFRPELAATAVRAAAAGVGSILARRSTGPNAAPEHLAEWLTAPKGPDITVKTPGWTLSMPRSWRGHQFIHGTVLLPQQQSQPTDRRSRAS